LTVTQVADEVDGRRLRRQQNREAVIDALLASFRDGVYQPSSSEIAQRAGLSSRSLFRYFDDIDDLHRAATARELRRARPLLEIGVGREAATEVKIRAVAAARVRLFEQMVPSATAARVAARRYAVVASELAERRSFLRAQLAELFAPELAGARSVLLPALDVLCSFESYELLRFDQRLSRPKTEGALVAALTTLLGTTGGAT
jgi:AcrR family transcriptional regulator